MVPGAFFFRKPSDEGNDQVPTPVVDDEMRKIYRYDAENTYMARTYGVEPYQLETRDGRIVCGYHDYQAPDARGIERCAACGATRHKDSQI